MTIEKAQLFSTQPGPGPRTQVAGHFKPRRAIVRKVLGYITAASKQTRRVAFQLHMLHTCILEYVLYYIVCMYIVYCTYVCIINYNKFLPTTVYMYNITHVINFK